MRRCAKVIGLCLALGFSAFAADLAPHSRLSGVYRLYGGSLADPTEATQKDKKVMFSLDGEAARKIFDAIGPDRKDLCTDGSGDRVRWRDKQNLFCMRTEKGEYSCNFGFDLRTGKSIGGIVC